ncbi:MULTISPECIES: polyprenyl synthetase family protein [unclassified Streptomyces]|uniref:polyprenyl synthetase family protein n=1 Tax=unclassified Streptomyces TaxID=2593676 RepID=UPI001BE8FCC4|nr:MULTISPECIES: polyprenyl synthetase family protein [unclassified Streptomyces]MBT2377827.1 polyprenyl synthetase family protein [Streptomyces sp. ISL-111]MBT2426553.1 polyprenyl synthetase family protein [Streptomyces sp. ISL-112]MBT2465585.1 polyprenyl synthetase family protein [Streptomyces sp. ISL-63]
MTLSTTRQASAPQILDRCRELVRPALVESVRRLHPWHAETAAFSLGWSGVDGDPVPGSQGKGVRQALAVLGAEAAGGSGLDGVTGAVAVELVHTFSLIHDDIMDGDETRRRRPTVWKTYGTGPAVLAGDALLALAVRILAEVPGPRGTAAVRHLSGTLGDLVHGQAQDLLFESRPWTGPEAVLPHEYRTMATHKTGSLLGCAAALGAVLAGAPAPTADALDRAGRHLGVAFQAVDDLLGIWGDPQITGKPVHSDLRRLKKTFPALAALASDHPAARRLEAVLTGAGPLDEAGLRRAAELVDEAGGRRATVTEAREHLRAARACLDGVELHESARGELLTLIPFLVDRTG